MIKFAIAGCGRIAGKHAVLCNQYGKLIAVCDIIPERAQQLGAEFGANIYFSLDELLEKEKDLSLLVICTPNGLHPEHTLAGLNHGLHVVCEKPMAILVSDAMKMIRVAEKAERELFIIKQNRYNQAVVETKRLVENNLLGKIFSIHVNAFWNRGPDYYLNSWHGDRQMDGGILFTQFSHFI